MKEGLIISGLTKVHDTFQTTTNLFLKVIKQTFTRWMGSNFTSPVGFPLITQKR